VVKHREIRVCVRLSLGGSVAEKSHADDRHRFGMCCQRLEIAGIGRQDGSTGFGMRHNEGINRGTSSGPSSEQRGTSRERRG
jgi:hypothetical protein